MAAVFVLWWSGFGNIAAGVRGVLRGGGRLPACLSQTPPWSASPPWSAAPPATAPRRPLPTACCLDAALLRLRFEGDGLGPLQSGYLLVAQVLLQRAMSTAEVERDCMLS